MFVLGLVAYVVHISVIGGGGMVSIEYAAFYSLCILNKMARMFDKFEPIGSPEIWKKICCWKWK